MEKKRILILNENNHYYITPYNKNFFSTVF